MGVAIAAEFMTALEALVGALALLVAADVASEGMGVVVAFALEVAAVPLRAVTVPVVVLLAELVAGFVVESVTAVGIG